MNWTGGRLSRHSGKRGGNLINIQKQHFAKVRTNLQNGTRKASPLKLTFFNRYHAPRVSTSPRSKRESLEHPAHRQGNSFPDRRVDAATRTDVSSRKSSRASQRPYRGSLGPGAPSSAPSLGDADEVGFLLENLAQDGKQSSFFLVKTEEDEGGLYDTPSPQDEQHQRSPKNPPLQNVSANKQPLPFEQRKRKLLEEPDWVGTSRSRPLRLKFPAVGARPEIGKRRRINNEDLKRRAEPPRRPYQPLISERHGLESGLFRPNDLANPHKGQDIWDIEDQELSIHIARQHQTSQATSQWSGIHTSPTTWVQRSSSESMLLDREETADGTLWERTPRKDHGVTYTSRLDGTNTRLKLSNTSAEAELSRKDNFRSFSQASGGSYNSLSPESRRNAPYHPYPSNLDEESFFDREIGGSGHGLILPRPMAATLGHLQSYGGAHPDAAHSAIEAFQAHSSSHHPDITEQGSHDDVEVSIPPESRSRLHEANSIPATIAVTKPRPRSNRLIFRAPLPCSSVGDSNNEGRDMDNSQFAPSAVADAGSQNDKDVVPAPEDIAWRDWLAIPAASISHGIINSQDSKTQSHSGTTDQRSQPAGMSAKMPMMAEHSKPGTPRGRELATTHIVPKGDDPTIQQKALINPALISAEVDGPCKLKSTTAPKPVNDDEIWMKFVFGDSDANENDLFNTEIDDKDTSQDRHDHYKATISSNSSMIAQASGAPVPRRLQQPHPNIHPSSDRAIEAAKFLFSDFDSSSLLSANLPNRRSNLENPSMNESSTSEPDPKPNLQSSSQSGPLTQISMYANLSSTSTTSPSPQASSLEQASMQNHDPATTSSPDPILAISPSVRRIQRQKIVFTKPAPFVGRRSQDSKAFHIGRKVIGVKAGRVGIGSRTNKSRADKKKNTRSTSIYDLPESDDRDERLEEEEEEDEEEEEEEEEEGVEDD
ncbi:MAG: hypothetical protein M1835_000287 [Candelina submexicana]|nr:MAG: hypothetical protein M1835_000287 [Candelina submexicana]